MPVPGFKAQAALYRSRRNYISMYGSYQAPVQMPPTAMPGGGGPCILSCSECDPHCMRTCSQDCDPGHTWTEACCTSTEGCCGGNCVDFRHDPNCGACGNKCSASNLDCCGGKCVNLNHNAQHCGKCGQDCGAGSCHGGVCKCVSGHTCNGTCCSAEQQCFHNCCVTNKDALALTSNSNYLLSSGCKDLKDLKVSFLVTEQLITSKGFSMQLNAYNPPGHSTDWMQYIFQVGRGEIVATIQYWDVLAACACPHPVCDCTDPTVALAASVPFAKNHIGAGTEFKIHLHNNESGHVTGATFTVEDNDGVTHSQKIDVDASHHFPIRAFEVNIVGLGGEYSNTDFTLGAGTLRYEISNGELCVQGGLPEQCTGKLFFTHETSNARYGPMEPPCCRDLLSQHVST